MNYRLWKGVNWEHIFLDTGCIVHSVSSDFMHILSHQKIYAQFWHVKVSGFSLAGFELVSKNSLLEFPVSRLTEKYFETIELL